MLKIFFLNLIFAILIMGKQLEQNLFNIDDAEIKQIISIDSHQLIYSHIQLVLAEQNNGTYINYFIQISDILVNNLFQPKFEIIQKIQYIPQLGEKCVQSFWIDSEEIIIYCVHNQLLQLIDLNNQHIRQYYDINYTDPIEKLKITYQSDSLFLFINLHLSNWQIQILEIIYSFLPFEEQLIPYETYSLNSQQFDQNITKFLIKNYFQLYVLTSSKEIYLFKFQNSIVSEVIDVNQTNTLLIDMDILDNELYLLNQKDDQCFVNDFSFKCSDDDLQLVVIDRQNFFLIINQTTIYSPFTNITFPPLQQEHCLIRNLRLFISYGNSSYMSIIYLEKDIPTHPMENQFKPISFAFDDSFFSQNHEIKFNMDQKAVIHLNLFIFGPPFNVKVIEDEFSIIDDFNTPNLHQICLNINDEYQFIHMLSENIFIYQIDNYIYYLVCFHESSSSNVILRKNQEQILFFQCIKQSDSRLIYFDDNFGKELHQYHISLQFNNPQIYVKKTIVFSNSIQTMKQSFNTISINHSDFSKTIISFGNHIQDSLVNENKLYIKYQHCNKVNNYILCTQNTISNGILTLLLSMNVNIALQINVYTIINYLIIDIAVINQEEIIVLLENSTDQFRFLRHYYIYGEQIKYLREIPTYSFKPIEFLERWNISHTIKALNSEGEYTVLIYDFSKKNSECLIGFIPYPNNVHLVTDNSIHILQNDSINNNNNLWSILEYNFKEFSITFKQVTQNQFYKKYTINLQIDNLLHKQNKTINIVGLDYTGNIYQLNNSVKVQEYQQFQPIYFSEFLYGPINEIICLNNCFLKSFVNVLDSCVYNDEHKNQFKKIIAAIIIDQQFLFFKNDSLLVLSFQESFNFSSNCNSKIVMKDINSHNEYFSIWKLEHESVQTLIGILHIYKKQKCLIKIEVYQWLERLILINQLSLENLSHTCQQLKKFTIKHNLFIIMDNSTQWFMYQYDFQSNSFNIIHLQFQADHDYSNFDYHKENDYLYFVSVNHQILLISKFNLTTNSMISEDSYPMISQLGTGIILKILHSNESKLLILYNQLFEASIYHFQINNQSIEIFHIQQLIIDSSIVQFTPIYFDQHKAIFQVTKLIKFKPVFQTQIYVINEKENYTFPIQVLFSINIILKYNQNKFLFINETSIGEATIGDLYEISIDSKNFEFEVTNQVSRIIIPMIAISGENNIVMTQIFIITLAGGLLCIFQLVLQREIKSKYIDLS